MFELLIDGDLIVYQATAASTVWKVGMKVVPNKKIALEVQGRTGNKIAKRQQQPSPSAVITQIDELIDRIVMGVKLELIRVGRGYTGEELDPIFKVYIKGDAINYRQDYVKNVPYKANRGDKPFYYALARKHIIKHYYVVMANGQETDDLLGIDHMNPNTLTIVASKDKDLKTVPGWNYDWFQKELKFISPPTADTNFYMQLLMGDRADNVSGIYGIGPVKAKKLLEDCKNKKEMLNIVLNLYHEAYSRLTAPRRGLTMLNEVGKLLYIRRKPDEIWSVEGVLNGE